ncbi:TraB/GumN family protein [Vibrio atypicus]|uniref:TraB/GumN family protein n=1 Tax=Vibrio atypicus TaxID=558271 RepID=UPI00135BDC87|nr:TraB/GumN family protein [Vibrio atypicus]
MHKYLCALILIFSTHALSEPLYWSAERGKLKYLIVGSVHVGDDSMYPLPEKISRTLAKSNGLILEADIRKTEGLQYPAATLASHNILNKQQQKDLAGIANLLELNPSEMLNAPPWAAALTIQMRQIQYLGYQADNGVDVHLMNKAILRNVPVLGLEPLQFQIDLLTGQKEGGKELLTSTIEQFDHNENAIHCLIDSWKAGDLQKLNQFAKLTEMSPEFEQAFLTDRNLNWVEKLADPSWLPNKKGQYVMVVGTLHLIGEGNVVSLLKEKGFRVKQLSTSEQAKCEFKY